MVIDAETAAEAFVDALPRESVEDFGVAVMGLSVEAADEDTWCLVICRVAETKPRLTPELQGWFSTFWIALRIANRVHDDETLRIALDYPADAEGG